MHLLHTTTNKLEEFADPPEYAILSHRWREEEVLFADIHQPHAMRMKGYAKIEECCKQARRDGYQYVWIDTCCIDKNSSAALAEAINSMYTWYKNAQVCYAYLDDVPDNEDPAPNSAFATSEWFTRGWTLQELIAPASLFFFDAHWREIGSKSSLAGLISSITGLHTDALTRVVNLQATKITPRTTPFSIATKMSWAAGRKTTRPEDRAYSLMGMFNVHMPVIYGEGEKKAFFRLQLEIIRLSHAQSIFAWTQPLGGATFSETWPFAANPDCFANSRNVQDVPSDQWITYSRKHISQDVIPRLDFSATNDGLDISLPLQRLPEGSYIALLSCQRPTGEGKRPFIGIRLQKSTKNAERYKRVYHHIIDDIDEPAGKFEYKNIHISFPSSGREIMPLPSDATVLFIQGIGMDGHGFSMMDMENAMSCDQQRRDGNIVLQAKRPIPAVASSWIAALTYHSPTTGERFVVTMGITWDYDGGPWFQITSDNPRDRTGAGQPKVDWTSYQLSAGRKVIVSVKKGGNALVGEKRTELVERYSVNITIYNKSP